MEEILLGLVQLSPVVAILIWVIFHFKSEIKIKDDEIQELHKELRAAEKENLTMLMKTVAFFEKIADKLDDLKK
jgi:hypothetical protein